MKRFAFLLWLFTLAAGCIVEDKPITPPDDGGVDAGPCGTCPVDKPVCTSALACVQCTSEDDDYCTAQGQLCDLGASSCVQCLGSSDCIEPNAARCDDNVCVPCTEQGHCDGIEGIGAAESACADGVCVDCTPETEADTCEDMVACDPAKKECTEIRLGAQDVCEACVSDSQCGINGEASDAHRCVPMFYELPDVRFPNAETGFCLKVFSPGGCEQPYAIETSERMSLSGNPLESYCGINEILATCPAVRALEQLDPCPPECPTSGLCRDVGGLSDTCTYPCESIAECLSNSPPGRPGSSCGPPGTGGTGGKYCGG